MDLNTLRHLGRYKEIILTLARFGFDEVIERLELPERIIPFRTVDVQRDIPFEERLRLLMGKFSAPPASNWGRC